MASKIPFLTLYVGSGTAGRRGCVVGGTGAGEGPTAVPPGAPQPGPAQPQNRVSFAVCQAEKMVFCAKCDTENVMGASGLSTQVTPHRAHLGRLGPRWRSEAGPL